MLNRKKVKFLFCVIPLGVFLLSGCSSDPNHEQYTSQNIEKKEIIEYAPVDIRDMIAEIDYNALQANVKYKGAYIKIINGQIDSVESDESYFTLNAPNADINLYKVKVYPQNNEQKNKLKELSEGQSITVYGKVMDVREIKGYSVALAQLEDAEVATKQAESKESPKSEESDTVNTPQVAYNAQTDSTNLYDTRTPDGLFRLYHLAITEHQLPIAYNCFTDDFKSQIEYSGWAAGYDTTLQSVPEDVEILYNDGYYATLSYRLRAVDRWGDSTKTQYFIGECNLIKVNGVWRIDSISARYA